MRLKKNLLKINFITRKQVGRI